jgi:hypothetical protein
LLLSVAVEPVETSVLVPLDVVEATVELCVRSVVVKAPDPAPPARATAMTAVARARRPSLFLGGGGGAGADLAGSSGTDGSKYWCAITRNHLLFLVLGDLRMRGKILQNGYV